MWERVVYGSIKASIILRENVWFFVATDNVPLQMEVSDLDLMCASSVHVTMVLRSNESSKKKYICLLQVTRHYPRCWNIQFVV